MAFNRDKARKTVQRLLGKKSAGDANRAVRIIKKSGFDYRTQSSIGSSYTIDNAVAMSFNSFEMQNDNIQVGDIKIMAEFLDDMPEINTGNTDCEIDGVTYDIINVKIDPLRVLLKIQARKK